MCSAMAPPWENPASAMRFEATPRSFSALISALYRLRGSVDAVEVFGGAPIDANDVVPRAHLVTIVDGHRPHRRMRKHKRKHGHAVVEQFGNQRLEVVTVGAEAVHPDDGKGGIGSGFDGDGFECLQNSKWSPRWSSW